MTVLGKFMNKSISLTERYGAFVLGAILLLTLVVRFAGPVRDGDFFWHIKYGEYMVENRTLIPDHTIYSWTPTDQKDIYCTWIGDILLYTMHKAGGLPLLFAFRYLCMLTLILVVWAYARRLGQGRDATTFLVLVIVLLSSFGAAFLKPEIMSLIFLALTSGIYFSVKASLWARCGTRPFLLYPLLFLIWVNTHGVFLFGMILLALITLGEILNYLFGRKNALTAQGVRHLLAGSLLSLAATFVTPYGYKMHLYLYDYLFFGGASQGMKTTQAVRSSFQPDFFLLHFLGFWIIMLVSFVALFSFLVWKKREWDWGILLPTVFLAWIFTRYVRCAFYWPAFWGMSIIYLQSRSGQYWQRSLAKARASFKIGFKSGIIILFLFLSIRAMYDSWSTPLARQWLGFGIGYQNPVQASAFLKEHRPGKSLYNSYDVGGYLIYDLYPVYNVFLDPRYFPYKAWFAEFFEFHYGATPIEEFLKKYPFDVALLDYHTSAHTIIKFISSRKWEPAFYGPSAIVFVRKDVNFSYDFKSLDKHRFDNLRNIHQAYQVFMIAQNLNDLETSGYILEIIKNKFSHMYMFEMVVRACTLLQDGLTAFVEKDYEKALANLSRVGYSGLTLRTNMTLTKLLNWKAKQFVRNREYRSALSLIEWILGADPNYANGLFNAGMLSYQVVNFENAGKPGDGPENSGVVDKEHKKDAPKWKDYFERFLKAAPNHERAPIVRQALEGKGLPPRVKLML